MKMCFRDMKYDECQKIFRQKSFLTCTYSAAKENIICSTKYQNILKKIKKKSIWRATGTRRRWSTSQTRRCLWNCKVKMKTCLKKGNIFHFICHVSGWGVDHARDARSDDGHLDQHGRQVKIPRFFCNFFKGRSRFPVFFAIFPRTPIQNYFEHLLKIDFCPHSKMNEESRFVDCESPQVPLLLQLAARRREAVRHHWHQVPWLPRTSSGISLIQSSNLEHLTAHWWSGTPSWLDRYSSAGWSRLEDLSRWSRTRRCPCNHRCRWQ